MILCGEWFLGIILLISGKVLRALGNGAEKAWLKNFQQEDRAYHQREMTKYRERKAEKERLLKQAYELESQSRYGSNYTRARLKREAEKLRREANRL